MRIRDGKNSNPGSGIKHPGSATLVATVHGLANCSPTIFTVFLQLIKKKSENYSQHSFVDPGPNTDPVGSESESASRACYKQMKR
jgi:hypothetical protein